MEFPVLKAAALSAREIRRFGGYCHRDHVEAGAFYDMQNMSGEHWPLLSPRKGRGVLSTRNTGIWNPAKSHPQALGELDGLCVLSDGILYYHLRSGLFQTVDLELSEQEPKQLIRFGTYLIVLPDKKYVNTRNPEDRGSLEAEFSLSEKTDVSFRLCNRDGAVYEAAESETAPEAPEDGQYWLDISNYLTGGTSLLKQYSKATEQWVTIRPTYVRMDAPGIGAAFQKGDWIFLESEALKSAEVLGGICRGARELAAAGNDYLVLDYPMGKAALQLKDMEQLLLRRSMPEMDFLFASENRLWGCRYGLDRDGKFVNRIYASKPGDFKNWYADSDSMQFDCSTDGPWTGAIHALGQPLFFKENYLHRVYGERQIQTLPCRGVQEGCHKSLAVVNGLLYYKATEGIVCYDGSLPECVSGDLGEGDYHSAVAGTLGNRYYVSMLDASDAPQLFCYDSLRRLWHREDGTRAVELCAVKDVLYYIQEGEPLVRILAGGESVEKAVPWFVETGRLEGEQGQQQYLRRITVRLSMGTGTAVRFYVQYDSRGPWQCICGITGNGDGTVSVPLRLRRCDHLRLRIEGEGEALVYSLRLELAKGGIERMRTR